MKRSMIFFTAVICLALYVVRAEAISESASYPFAMCSNAQIFDNQNYPKKMLDAGALMCRADFVFSNVRPNADPQPNSWNWKLLNGMRALHGQYPALNWLVLLGYSATWAQDPRFAKSQGDASVGGQRGILVTPPESPDNLYGNYVYEVVRRYKDVAHTFESWNEPDLPNHTFFKGNGKDFFPYQRACYLAAKKADPSCRVLFAGMCYANVEGYMHTHGLKPPTPTPANSSFFEEYLQECVKDPQAKSNNYYFDVMSQHSYSRATDLFDYVDVDRAMMQTYLKVQKPVWITECGFGVLPGSALGGTEDDFCDYLLQSFAWAKLADVEKIFHFQLDNSNGHGLYDGQLGNPRPALRTYRDVLVRELSDAKLVSQLHGNRGVGFIKGNSPFQPSWTTGYDLFEFKSNDGKRRMLMAFTDTSKPVQISIPATKSSAILIDRRGARTTISPVGGSYKVSLAGATNRGGFPILDDSKMKALGSPEHLVGGSTVVLVEQ